MKKLVKVYAVMQVLESKMIEVFRSTSKDECKKFKQKNKSLKKLAIMYIANQ
jgi:hypothetical protein